MKKLAKLIVGPNIYGKLVGVRYAVPEFCRKVKHRLANWFSYRSMVYGKFRENRHVVSNGMVLFMYCTSAWIPAFLRLSRWVYGRAAPMIKAKYRDGMTLYFPADTSRYFGMFTDMVADQYVQDYQKYYGHALRLEKGEVIIDVGAHIGKFSVPMLRRHPGIRLYAFEPDPANYACLNRNLLANCPALGHYQAFNCAVSDRREDVVFSVGRFSTQGSLGDLGFAYQDKNARQIQVHSLTLADVFENNGIERCALLKLDCEGSEYLIFENLPDEIFGRIQVVFMELHSVSGKSKEGLKRLLADKGFAVKGHERSDGGWELYCEKSDSEASGI